MANRLLLVDDDACGLYAFAEALRRRLPQVTIDTALSAERALVILNNTSVDVMVTDFRMPDMDGLDLLRRAKTLQPRCSVFIVTGCDTGIRDQALRLGAVGFAEKPVILEEFVLALKRLLLHREASLA
jgi:DNA-binding NtrC family response regulator